MCCECKKGWISNELSQSSPGVQIYPNLSQNSEFESLAGRSKRISSKVHFNVTRDPNISLGLKNYGENVCFFNSVIRVLYSSPVFRDYINRLRPLVKVVAMKIKIIFGERLQVSLWGHLVMCEVFRYTTLWTWNAIWCTWMSATVARKNLPQY